MALQTDPVPLQPTHQTVAAVAHDLKLPLSHIKGFVSSLRRDDLEWDGETRQEFLAEIENEVDRLAQMVDRLMRSEVSHARNRRKPNRLSIDPAVLVNATVQRARALFGSRPIQVDVAPGLPRVCIDAAEIERLLMNLLQNAVKYSPASAPISVCARMHGSTELELAVDDAGPGIPTKDQRRVFEPSFRSQAASESEVPGHGLGLAICQSIALAHGGRMGITDRARGTRFSVFLPVENDFRTQRKQGREMKAA